MDDKDRRVFQLSFNGLLKLDIQGSGVTCDGRLIDEHLTQSRQGANRKFPLADLLHQSVYSRLAGYEDLNHPDRVPAGPTFCLIGPQRNCDRGAALTSTLHGFETELPASDGNSLGPMAVNRELVAQAARQDDSERVVLDRNSTASRFRTTVQNGARPN